MERILEAAPDRTHPDVAPFWDGIAEREIRIPRCSQCGSWVWYPKGFCPACQCTELVWTVTPGQGTLFTYTVVFRSFIPGDHTTPYAVGLLSLAGALGVRLVGKVEAEPELLRIGLPLIVDFRPEAGGLAPVFIPGETSSVL